jgi:hypothetical protein
MFLQHPELLIEFLVPERGRGCAAVKDLPDLGMNAQPLRFLDVALQKTIRLHFDDIPVTVPHPAAFALHKLLVAGRRKSAAKRKRDIDSALDVLALIEKKGEIAELQAVMAHFPPSWKKTVLKALRETQRLALAERLGR